MSLFRKHFHYQYTFKSVKSCSQSIQFKRNWERGVVEGWQQKHGSENICFSLSGCVSLALTHLSVIHLNVAKSFRMGHLCTLSVCAWHAILSPSIMWHLHGHTAQTKKSGDSDIYIFNAWCEVWCFIWY